MRTSLIPTPRLVLPAAVIAISFPAAGADLTSAKVTQVVRDVAVMNASDSRPAAVGDSIRGKTALATGRQSRAELEFNDRTLLRLGSNTIFSLVAGSRTIEMEKGAVLLQTAPGSGGVNIRAGSVTAAITGSLGFFSVAEPTDWDRQGKELVLKLISIHGGIALEAKGKTYRLKPLEILVARIDLEGRLIGEPEIRVVDGEKLLATSKLVNGFPGNGRIDDAAILGELDRQGAEKEANQWVVVSRNPADPSPSLSPSRQTVGLNALIRRFLPKTEVVQPPSAVTPPNPPKRDVVVRVFPKPKPKGKGRGMKRPKGRPKPKPRPQNTPSSPQGPNFPPTTGP